MAPHEEEDDPAVYRSSSHKKQPNGHGPPPPPKNGSSSHTTNGNRNGRTSTSSPKSSPTRNGTGRRRVQEEPMDSDPSDGSDAEDDEDDGTLLTVQPGFNRLLLVLRDEKVMRFVKYVSAAAEGSRWDVCGEYEVGMVEEDGEDA